MTTFARNSATKRESPNSDPISNSESAIDSVGEPASDAPSPQTEPALEPPEDERLADLALANLLWSACRRLTAEELSFSSPPSGEPRI